MELVLGLLAVWKAGGAYVSLEPSLPGERLAFVTRDAAPRAILKTGDCSSAVRASGVTLLILSRIPDSGPMRRRNRP